MFFADGLGKSHRLSPTTGGALPSGLPLLSCVRRGRRQLGPAFHGLGWPTWGASRNPLPARGESAGGGGKWPLSWTGSCGVSGQPEGPEQLGQPRSRAAAERSPGPWAPGRVTDTAGGEGPTLPSAPASALAAESPPSPLCWPPALSSFSHSAPSPGPGHGTAGRKETHPFTKRSCGPSDNLTLKGSWDHTH